MNDNGYTGDRHTLPRVLGTNPGAMPLGLTGVAEELKMKWQNQNGGDQTYSPIRNRAQSVSATGNRSERLFGTSVPNSKSPLQQMTGSDEVVAGIRPSMFGGTLRRKKPPVARPPQEKKTEQEVAGAGNELAQILKRRLRKNGENIEDSSVTPDKDGSNAVPTQAPDSEAAPPTDADPKTSAEPIPSRPPVVTAAVPIPSRPPVVTSAVPIPSRPPPVVTAAVPIPSRPPVVTSAVPRPPPVVTSAVPIPSRPPVVTAAVPRPSRPPVVTAAVPIPSRPPVVTSAVPRPPPVVTSAVPIPSRPPVVTAAVPIPPVIRRGNSVKVKRDKSENNITDKIEKPCENSVPPQEMSVKPQAKPINDKIHVRREALSVEKQTIADPGSTATAIEQTTQQFQLQQKVSAPTLSSTATRSLQDEGALRVAHDTGVDPHQATVGGTMETKVEASIAIPKPAVLQNQKDGLNIWDLSNRAEGKQDDTDQRMRRLQDDHTRMYFIRQIGTLQEEMRKEREQLQDEHMRMVEEMKAQHQEQMYQVQTQKSVQKDDRDVEIEDLRLRLEVAHEHVTQQNDAVVQMTFDYEALQIQMADLDTQEIVKDLEGKVELYQFQVRQYENDFNEERAARERAAGEQENEKRTHKFEIQLLEDNLKEAVESERALKQHATKELDEMRRKQTGLEMEFNKTLAIQISQLEAAQAEKARLLTTADQTWLDYQRQLDEIRQQKDGLNHTIVQYEADIQHLLADKESSHELQGKIGEFECVIRGLTANLEHKKNENRMLGVTVQQLEERIQLLEARLNKDELAPYVLHQLPYLGECQGAGSYGSVYRIHLNGISCIAKRIHDILLGQGREKGVNIEDKRAAYQKFYAECVLLSRMRHPNIVQFMGVHYGPQRDYGRELTLVMERLYMNLEDCLEHYQNIEMWLRVSILLDVSQGLLHLHFQGIVHRDLTAANILLTTSFHAKIADLGVSKIIDVHPLAASKQSMIPGTLGYMPPEALAEIPEYGSALDVFSFGVLILFVLLQEYPQYYDNLVTPEGLARKESHIQKRSKWINKLSSGNQFRPLICDCLQDVAARRPSTKNLNSKLIQIAEMYPKPYQDVIDMLLHLAQPQHGFSHYSS